MSAKDIAISIASIIVGVLILFGCAYLIAIDINYIGNAWNINDIWQTTLCVASVFATLTATVIAAGLAGICIGYGITDAI